MGDPGAVNGAVNPNTLCSLQRTVYPGPVFHRRAHTHPHTPCYFMVLTGGTVCPTLSSQWSICTHHKQWQYCTSHTVSQRQRHMGSGAQSKT